MKSFIASVAVAAAALGLAACDVEQTEEGELPEVQGGNLPEYDVDTATIDADAGTKEVEVPDTVEVPTLDVDVKGPNEGEANAEADRAE